MATSPRRSRAFRARLADLLGVSRQTVSSLEVGRYTPSLQLALKLVRVFQTPEEEMFDE